MSAICRLPCFLAAVLEILLSAGASPRPQQLPQVPIRVETTLVNVPVLVEDRKGAHVANLGAADFSLYEDRVNQPIAHFSTSEEPLAVALLLDTSQSTRKCLGDIKGAAREFLRQLRPRDRAMVVSFDYEVQMLCSLTEDHKALEAGIKEAKAGARVGTKLRDAVRTAAVESLQPLQGRKAIILLTDGRDAGSRTSESALLESVSELDAVVYSIFYQAIAARRIPRPQRDPFPRLGRGGRRGGIYVPPPPIQRAPLPPPDNPQRRQRVQRAMTFLEELSLATGGDFHRSEIANLKKVFQHITDELRHEYLLGFYPDTSKLDGKPHELAVRIARPGLIVRCRQSYRAAKWSGPQN